MADVSGESSTSQIRLQCLSGDAAPQPVQEGWQGLMQFPEDSRPGFWELLGSIVMEPNDPSYQERLETFCQTNKLEHPAVMRALQACDFLLRGATALNLDSDLFRQDLMALSNSVEIVPDELLERYQSVQPHLRNRLVESTLTDHGKVLSGLDWRVDNVLSSDRGAQLNSTVVYLTLRYQDGDDLDRITLQLTPSALQQLKAFTDRFGQ
jgi:COMM domain